jgi:choline monooxygenase
MSNTDIHSASTLKSEFYTSQEVFTQIREKVFATSWQLAPDLTHIKTPGETYPFTLLEGFLNEPLVITRDMKDEVHCLSNVCTHRGNIVVERGGKCNTLKCGYHGRRFALDGKFQHMPEFEKAEGFPSKADDLPALKTGRVGNFLFTSIAPLHSFDEVFGPMLKRMSWFPWDDLRFDQSRSKDYLVNANWALYCDNFLEGFHIPFIHPSLNAALSYGEYITELYDHSNLQVGFGKSGTDCFHLPEGHVDHGKNVAAYYYWIFPNLMFNFYPWGLSVNVVKPVAVDLTKVSFMTYIYDQSKLDRGAGALLDRVEREDESVVENVQKGVRSRFYSHGRYSPTKEQGVHHFHSMMRKLVDL